MERERALERERESVRAHTHALERTIHIVPARAAQPSRWMYCVWERERKREGGRE